MKVKLTKPVFIYGKLHKVDSVIDVDQKHYSDTCMVKVANKKPAKAE